MDIKTKTFLMDTLLQARAVLTTCANDGPGDYADPARLRVLERKIRQVGLALSMLGAHPVTPVAGPADESERVVGTRH